MLKVLLNNDVLLLAMYIAAWINLRASNMAWLAASIVWLMEVKTDAYGQISSHFFDAYCADCFWNTAFTDFWEYLYVTVNKVTV